MNGHCNIWISLKYNEGICFILLILLFLPILPDVAFYSAKTRVVGRMSRKNVLQILPGLEVGFLAEFVEISELL